jgi:hypothetical protein
LIAVMQFDTARTGAFVARGAGGDARRALAERFDAGRAESGRPDLGRPLAGPRVAVEVRGRIPAL